MQQNLNKCYELRLCGYHLNPPKYEWTKPVALTNFKIKMQPYINITLMVLHSILLFHSSPRLNPHKKDVPNPEYKIAVARRRHLVAVACSQLYVIKMAAPVGVFVFMSWKVVISDINSFVCAQAVSWSDRMDSDRTIKVWQRLNMFRARMFAASRHNLYL